MTFESIALNGPHRRLKAILGPEGSSPLFQLLMAFGAVWLILYFVFFIYRCMKITTYPFQIEYMEPVVLDHTVRLSHGQSIYRPIEQAPFRMSPFTPFYPFINAPLVKLFGTTFFFGRLISSLSSLGLGVILYKTLKRLTYRPMASLWATVLFFALPPIYIWSPMYRPDMLAALLSLLGLYGLLFERSLSLCSLFFILGFFTKQTYVVAPVAGCLYLLSTNRARGFRLAILTFGGIFGLMFLGDLMTHGQLSLHTIRYTMNPFLLKRFWLLTVRTSMLKVLPMFCLGMWAFSFKPFRQNQGRLFLLYFILSTLSTLTAGKVGSNINYYIEFSWAVALAFGLALARLQDLSAQRRGFSYLIPAFLLVQASLLYHLPHSYEFMTHFKLPDEKKLEASQKLSSYVKSTKGKVVSVAMDVLVLNGRDIEFEPFMFTQLATQDLWDQQAFLRKIETKSYDLIIIPGNLLITSMVRPHQFLTPEMAQAITTNYTAVELVGEHLVFKPKV